MARGNDPTGGTPFVVHDDGRVVSANDAARSLLGRESLAGAQIVDLVPDYVRDVLTDQFERLATGEDRALGLTVELETQSGDGREVIALSSPVDWDGAERLQTLLIDTDRELPEGLSANAIDASPVGLTLADATREDEPLVYVNDPFLELTGYDREEVLGRNCRFLQGEETNEETVAAVRAAIDAEEPVTVELRNYRKDGSMFWNRLSVAPIADEQGTVQHFVGFQEDISEKKLYEREKELFEMQAESVDQTIVITDAEGTIVYVNPQFERTTGYSAAEAIGSTPRILKSGQHDEAFYREMWETILDGEVWEARITNRRKSGERYRSAQKIVPITDADGDIAHFVAIENDITDQLFTEQVLDVMNRVLRHNVRNALISIDGHAELLEEELEEPERQAAVGAIREQTAKLEKLSEETRTIRELYRRRHTQHALSVEAIEGFVDNRRELHPDATIEFAMDLDADLEVPNGSLLQLALDEAIENAVVHSDRDHPHVEVTVALADERPEIVISIADDGPGLPDEEWQIIEAGEETQLAHGRGIGLWLMYWTKTALGGDMSRTANDPRGTVITFRIPVEYDDDGTGWDRPG